MIDKCKYIIFLLFIKTVSFCSINFVFFNGFIFLEYFIKFKLVYVRTVDVGVFFVKEIDVVFVGNNFCFRIY